MRALLVTAGHFRKFAVDSLYWHFKVVGLGQMYLVEWSLMLTV